MRKKNLGTLICLGLVASIVQADKIDLFMLAGQSNAQGWMGDAGSYPDDVKGMDHTIPFFWETPGISSSKGSWTTLKPQGGIFPKGHFGLEITLARSLKKVGYRPAIFKYTLGGTSIARNWGGPGDGKMYDRMVSQFRRARAALEEQGHEVNVRAFIWIQGESDAENIPMARAFGGRLQRLIDDLRENVVKDRHLPIILGVDEQNDWVKLRPQVAEAQREIAEKDPFIVCTTLYGLPKADSTHLTPEGLVFHGKRIFEAYQDLILGRKGDRALFPLPSAKPNAIQKAMSARKYGMFIHYGINTFHDKEWTDGTLSPLTYAPTAVDTDNWARTARDAGMSYVILVCKHHEGFCLWDSKFTDYDVSSSSNRTDVVRSMARSCRKYGIQLGLYYSLWDRNWGKGCMRSGNAKARMTPVQVKGYRKYMRDQLTELLTHYGPICELWMDGGWTQPNDVWGIPEIYALTRKLQPNCALGVNLTIGSLENIDKAVKPNAQRTGDPIRYFPSDFRLWDPFLPSNPDPKLFTHAGQLYYLPFEATVCLNNRWFFHTGDKGLKPLKTLADLYRKATAQENVLVLNSPPTRDGVMPERNVKRLRELADLLGLKRGENL